MGIQFSIDQVLIAVCGCFCGNKNYMRMMETNLEALDKPMQQLEEKRDDLLIRVELEEERGLHRLAQVKGWLSRVEAVRSQVNDLLEDRSTETSRLCLRGFCSVNCISSYEYGEKVAKKLEEVKELLSEGKFDVVAEKVRAPKVEIKHIQTTVGLDAKVKEAWDRLMKDGRTLGLYGMGGVGKTTLLACINNKFIEIEKKLDIVIWVVVSKNLQNEGIQDQILGRLRPDKEWKQATEEEKASLIYSNLKGKKFVLLLDDLWSEVAPPTRENGSKIVFTTRLKEVCKHMKADDEMKVDCLSPDEAWELFQQKVGENPLKSHHDFIPLARNIAETCCGLPLSLCVIGKAMACKETVQEWRHAISVLNSSSHEFPGMEENILSILKFSYDGLKDEKVKSCFLHCSLFPEDYEIEKEKLIEYWINEGFIDGNKGEDGPNNQGHDIIGSLVRAHLLMESRFTMDVKMHDVIRDMALWIASKFGKHEETFFVRSGVRLSQIPKDINWEFVERISLMKNKIAEISCRFNCPNLLTLLLRDNKLVDLPGEFFRFMPAIVVLDLSENRSLIVLPEEISNLGSLQYLNLSYTLIRLLPNGFKELRKLTYLNLEFTRVESIVGIATTLPNLQVLKLLNCMVYVDDILMEELQQLEHLKILTANVKEALILESIQAVGRLASCIQGLCLKNMSAENITLNTLALAGLQHLRITDSKICEIKIDFGSKEKRKLLFTGPPGFKQLSTIDIISFEGPKDLTWLIFAQDLRFLRVGPSSSLEEIINKEKVMSISNEHPDIVEPFVKLESISLRGLVELKGIYWNPQALTNIREFKLGGPLSKLFPETATEFLHRMGE